MILRAEDYKFCVNFINRLRHAPEGHVVVRQRSFLILKKYLSIVPFRVFRKGTLK
jgi:hypothetical protein